MSLLHESIRTLVVGGIIQPADKDSENPELIQIVSHKMKTLLDHPDANRISYRAHSL